MDHLQSWPVNLCTLPTLFQSGFAVTLEQTLRTQPFCILKFEIQTHLQANSFYLWKLLFQSDILSDVTCQPLAQLKWFSTPFISLHIPAIGTNLLFSVFSHPLQSFHTWIDNLEYMCWLSKLFQHQNFFLLPQWGNIWLPPPLQFPLLLPSPLWPTAALRLPSPICPTDALSNLPHSQVSRHPCLDFGGHWTDQLLLKITVGWQTRLKLHLWQYQSAFKSAVFRNYLSSGKSSEYRGCHASMKEEQGTTLKNLLQISRTH